MFIPRIGNKITLSKPWKFKLHDEYRNEKFWQALLGNPQRTIYYYGYHPAYHESAVQTPTTNHRGTKKADPVDVTLPKGTVLQVDRIYIKKGQPSYDSLSFVVTKGQSVPPGRFWASLDEVNNTLDISSDVGCRWPEGKFMIRISEGTENACACGKGWQCVCNKSLWPKYKNTCLSWSSETATEFSCSVRHYVNTQGRDEVSVNGGYRGSHDEYTKTFEKLSQLIDWAKKKNCPEIFIDAFVNEYQPKNDAWQKSKAKA